MGTCWFVDLLLVFNSFICLGEEFSQRCHNKFSWLQELPKSISNASVVNPISENENILMVGPSPMNICNSSSWNKMWQFNQILSNTFRHRHRQSNWWLFDNNSLEIGFCTHNYHFLLDSFLMAVLSSKYFECDIFPAILFENFTLLLLLKIVKGIMKCSIYKYLCFCPLCVCLNLAKWMWCHHIYIICTIYIIYVRICYSKKCASASKLVIWH